MNNLVFSYLFSKGLQILIQQLNTPDIIAVIRLQAATRAQNATILTMKRVFFNNKIVKYYLVPQFILFSIPSIKTDTVLFTLSFLLRYEKTEDISKKLHINVIIANKEIIVLKVVSKFKLTICNIDVKVNSQKLDVQILINPEQIKY
ncbi:unnamed protein product [Paramecium pentaurelia]|uniref:Uncharacterized protein n=1 Tax=Paramecium pentaurelia TaxID=43138 RepID=A0A8S1Y8B1_9CILI|nr:unnamed protein product [Paramecium pentaurelia]